MLVVLTNEEYRKLKSKADKYDELQENQVEDVEDIKIEENVKFKIGDTVTLIKAGVCTQGFEIGDKCTVTNYASGAHPFEILKITKTEDEEDKIYGYVYESQIEKVREEE